MRNGLLALMVLMTAAASDAAAQSAADSAAIVQTALDYIEGWYSGDAERMQRALHPELAKRIVVTDATTNKSSLREMGAEELVEGTRSGIRYPDPERGTAEGCDDPRCIRGRGQREDRRIKLDRLSSRRTLRGTLGHRERALGAQTGELGERLDRKTRLSNDPMEPFAGGGSWLSNPRRCYRWAQTLQLSS